MAVGRICDVSELVVVDREAPVGTVDPLELVELRLEIGQLRQRREARVPRGVLRRRLVSGVRMIAHAGGPEETRILAAELLRPRCGRRAAKLFRGGAPQLVVILVDAVQHPQERQRLGLREVPGKPSRMRGVGPADQPSSGELADQDRVAAVARRLQRAPPGVDEAPVHVRRDKDRRAIDRLRPEILAEVGLVPDRPEADPGQRLAGILGVGIAAAVPGRHRAEERSVLGG